MADGPPADPLALLLPLLAGESPAAGPLPWPSDGALGTALLGALERHGLAPAVHALMGDNPVPGLTGEQRSALVTARRATAAATLAHLRALERVDEAFGERGIRGLVLKGRALAQAAWPDPTLRPSCDVDLMVPPNVLEEAGAAFTAAGWEPTPQGRGKWRPAPGSPGLPPLDVTCAPRAEGARNPTWRPDLADLMGESRPMSGFRALNALAPHHAFVHAAVHCMDHGASRFIWLLDLALFLRGGDELFVQRVLEHAEEAQARRATALALHLVGRLLGPLNRPLPPAPWGTGWFVDRVLGHPVTWGDEGMGRAGRFLLRLLLVDRPGDLLR